ncbi:MAG: hypothetical protein WC728_05640 [Elusimicrobiota bacterium]
MNQSYRIGKAVLVVMGAYHLIVGLSLLFSGELSLWGARVFGGMMVTGSPELGILGEILACYILAFGAMMIAAAHDPVKNRACISIGAILCGLRVIQRILFGGKVIDVFQVNPARYWGHVVVVLVLGCLLAYLRWQIHQETRRTAPAA